MDKDYELELSTFITITVSDKRYLYFIISSSTTNDRSTTHPKFNPTGVRIHDLQIIMGIFYVTETPALTTRPSVTYKWIR